MDIAVCLMKATGETEMRLVEDATFDKLRKIIGCRNAEYVLLPKGRALLVDEEGLLTEEPLYNEFASIHAKRHIVGDALVVKLSDMDKIPYL
jgi:hypothetical protein